MLSFLQPERREKEMMNGVKNGAAVVNATVELFTGQIATAASAEQLLFHRGKQSFAAVFELCNDGFQAG